MAAGKLLVHQGAELLDETTSNSDRGSADEHDRAKYERWREQAKDSKKDVYEESPLAHGDLEQGNMLKSHAQSHASAAHRAPPGSMYRLSQCLCISVSNFQVVSVLVCVM